MRIRKSINVDSSTSIVMEAARSWMRGELGDGGEILDRPLKDGSHSISSIIEESDIRITTSMKAIPVEAGSKLTMVIRMQGTTFLAKIRNLAMLPMTAIVRRQMRVSLEQIVESIQSGRADTRA